jgi:hypothetical protein
MQLSALQISYIALPILIVALVALLRDLFKKRRVRVDRAAGELTARLNEAQRSPDDPAAKVQPIDGLFSKRRSASKTWPEDNVLSIVHAGPRISSKPPSPLPSPEPAAPISTCTALMLPPVTVDALLWERLLAMPTPAEIRAATTRRVEPPPDAVVDLGSAQSETPAGMIEEPALKEMLARAKPFSGLVMSIGLNEPDEGVWRGEGLYQSITNFVAGVLGANDFGCRTAIDEFLVIAPDKLGADAQNHLNSVADRLWDFQLRGIGACAILFSWGGATCDGQSLSSAITSATQRMRQAKQRRNLSPALPLRSFPRAN